MSWVRRPLAFISAYRLGWVALVALIGQIYAYATWHTCDTPQTFSLPDPNAIPKGICKTADLTPTTFGSALVLSLAYATPAAVALAGAVTAKRTGRREFLLAAAGIASILLVLELVVGSTASVDLPSGP